MAPLLRTAPWRAYQGLVRQKLHGFNARSISTSNSLRATNHAGANPLRSRASTGAAGQGKDNAPVAQYQKSIILSAVGIVASAAAMYGVIKMDIFGLDALESNKKNEPATNTSEPNTITTDQQNGTLKMDGPAGFPSDGGPSVIPLQGQDNVDQVPTGTSTVPYFPTTIRLPSIAEMENKQTNDDITTSDGDEYQLLGLGIRTVSFLRVQVYVVGLYVAKADITELQQRLVRTAIHPPVASSDEAAAISGIGADAATSLRQQLKELLLDPEHGDAAWNALIKENGIRTVFRIVPTRNTDFMHLRDGWVRSITNRAQEKKPALGSTTPGEFDDAGFGTAMNEFKSIFGGSHRKSLPKGQTLFLLRTGQGALEALLQPSAAEPMSWVGRVADERVSRLVWLNYLAGKSVSSEGARQSIVDGLVTVVERPVGTVVQRVV
ncbi:uncharacterized protein N7483_006279 [Penicillium malachiteum]|uniref:uncharacterized protein n=1 Tax=Penicillium malachiteum TaxID=1324776 RepID=UPI0025492A29|nr:uncharacterized protein N7483_006279 [Penicillium malachiteum]KAJ5731771.1 hypothetical protein N7483_006279 [Penicillium malachiteum]